MYGLGGDATNPEASRKIYAAKGRPSDNPLIVHIADFSQLEDIVAEVPQEARDLAEAFWPGPLTMILRKNEVIPYETTGGLDTVAIRMPSHPVARRFLQDSGCMIAAPSANTSGRPSPTTAQHVWEDLQGKIEVLLDGGPVGIGIESTIVDLSEDQPMILRPGFITQEMLSQVLGQVGMDPGHCIGKQQEAAKGTGHALPPLCTKGRPYLGRGTYGSGDRKDQRTDRGGTGQGTVRWRIGNSGKSGCLYSGSCDRDRTAGG